MNWNDTLDIAIALSESHSDVDPRYIRFTDLCDWVTALPGFKGNIEQCNEKILEAIQMAWLEELE